MWLKRCNSDKEPGVIEETIRTKEQPGNENDLEPSTTKASKCIHLISACQRLLKSHVVHSVPNSQVLKKASCTKLFLGFLSIDYMISASYSFERQFKDLMNLKVFLTNL